MITLLIASAALVTSAVSAYEMVLQRKNAVRPVLVLLERVVDHADPSKKMGLYLVNMGQAVAVEVTILESEPSDLIGPGVKVLREIASGRRSLIREYEAGQETDFGRPATHLLVSYFDVNGNTYETEYRDCEHDFRRAGPLDRWLGRRKKGGRA